MTNSISGNWPTGNAKGKDTNDARKPDFFHQDVDPKGEEKLYHGGNQSLSECEPWRGKGDVSYCHGWILGLANGVERGNMRWGGTFTGREN